MPSIASPGRFYVYILARPDGSPFYVGKGQGKRMYGHDAEARRGHKCRKCNTIRKIWSGGGEVQRYVIFRTDDEQEAFAYERKQIALYGRENLTNLTDGGDGISGHSHTREARTKISAARKIHAATTDGRAQLDEARKHRAWSAETRAKLGAANRGRNPSLVARARMSDAGKKRAGTPESRAKVSQQMRGRTVTAETRAKQSATQKIVQSRPDIVAARQKRSLYTSQPVFCPNGHQYTEATIYTFPRGGRACRICRLIRKREYNQKRRLAKESTKNVGNSANTNLLVNGKEMESDLV